MFHLIRISTEPRQVCGSRQGPRSDFDALDHPNLPSEPGPLGGTIKVTTNLTILEVLAMRRLMFVSTEMCFALNFDVLGGALLPGQGN
jgi:hypothetical protein